MEDITFYIVAMFALIYVFSLHWARRQYFVVTINTVQETFIEKNVYLPILLAWSICTQYTYRSDRPR
jgi:hypothetical protein